MSDPEDIELPDTTRPHRVDDDEYLSSRARRFLLASSLVRDACVCRLQINYKRDLASVRLYERFYARWSLAVYYTLTIVNLATILLEYPGTVLRGGYELPYQIPLVINLICEAYFYYRWYIIYLISEKGKPWDNVLTKLSLGILLVMSADAVIYIVCHSVPGGFPIRFSRFLRPLLLLTFPENRKLRAAFDSLRRTAIDVIPLFALMFTVIIIVSVVAAATLAGQKLYFPDGRPYFNDFMQIIWDLYVLTTSANSPDVIIPVYEYNRVYILLYVVVCVLCNWLFMSILVAFVYNSYRRHLGEFVLKMVTKQKKRLDEAFQLVATVTPTGEYGITQGTFMRLLRVAKPGRSEEALRVLFHVLDVNRSGYLDDFEFSRLAHYVRVHLDEVELSRKHFETFVPKFYSLYALPAFQIFRQIVQHPVTSGFFVTLVFANVFTCVLLRGYPSIQSSVEWFLTVLFVLEIIAKYLASGGVGYFNDRWNKFDCGVVLLSFFAQLLQSILELLGFPFPKGVTQMFLLFRVIRLLKFFSFVKEFRCIVENLFSIGPSLLTYAAIMLIFYYIFTCFAVEAFGNLYEPVSADNYTEDTSCFHPALLGTDYVKMHYCLFNFNSPTEAFIMLLAISVGNNWHILAEGSVRTTFNLTRLFFLFVHWTCVLVVLNVVLAFIIEAYLIEYRDPKNHLERYVRRRLQELGMDAETELRKRGLGDYGQVGFHLTPKQLNAAFPPNSPVQKTFQVRNEVTSLDVMMIQMFKQEVGDVVERTKRKKFVPPLIARMREASYMY